MSLRPKKWEDLSKYSPKYSSTPLLNTKNLFILAIILVIVSLISFCYSMSFVISYRASSKELQRLQEELQTTPESTTVAISGEELRQIVEACPGVQKIALVATMTLQGSGYAIDKEISVKDLSTVSNTLVEIDIIPVDARNVINFLADKGLPCKSFTCESELISLVIQI